MRSRNLYKSANSWTPILLNECFWLIQVGEAFFESTSIAMISSGSPPIVSWEGSLCESSIKRWLPTATNITKLCNKASQYCATMYCICSSSVQRAKDFQSVDQHVLEKQITFKCYFYTSIVQDVQMSFKMLSRSQYAMCNN